MTVRVVPGDCLEAMPRLAAEGLLFDACVTDPPYHLTTIVNRLSKDGAAPIVAHGMGGAYARTANGFMNQTWDGGDVAFRVETWRAVYGLLKPGGHVAAFSAPRTYHRMACAIEDAGFEIRDMVGWLYGTGFPKSKDQAAEIDRLILGDYLDEDELSRGPVSHTAAHWEGWGTACKPAHEPICLARKPMRGSVAENLIGHGAGALNIDGCRVPTADVMRGSGGVPYKIAGENHRPYMGHARPRGVRQRPGGRHPANILHDGSAEVLSLFPESKGQNGSATGREPSSPTKNVYGAGARKASGAPRGDLGSAARFFYCAKADADDRDGSKHPTVKPVALMQWLVRLVTPWGGLVLDPFAGTGTTGAACLREGVDAVLIEREAAYLDDIRRRLARMTGADTPLMSGAAS